PPSGNVYRSGTIRSTGTHSSKSTNASRPEPRPAPTSAGTGTRTVGATPPAHPESSSLGGAVLTVTPVGRLAPPTQGRRALFGDQILEAGGVCLHRVRLRRLLACQRQMRLCRRCLPPPRDGVRWPFR